MNKRTFLKTSSVLLGGAVLSPYMACRSSKQKAGGHLTNWAGNLEYSTGNVHYPKTVEQVQETVRKCNRLRALGSRHSFNKIADSNENQISLKELNKVVSLDKASNVVTVEGGMRYGELAPYLHENGYALHNLASLPHISIAGACATATHGSGVKNGNLATAVSAIEFVNAAGDLVILSKKKDGDQFRGAVVGLGGLGIVTKLTLDLLPTFNMKQVVYLNLPMKELEKNFYAIVSSGYSVSLFTDWKNKNINEVWIKSRVDEDRSTVIAPDFYGAKAATQNMHPVEDQSAENVTDQMGIPGPWYERMPHFKMGFTPSTGKELQSEYFVPRQHAVEAILAVERLQEQVSPHLLITEIRTVAADSLWMSPCYKQPCVTIHFTWKQDWPAVSKILPVIEKELTPFRVRPHWGKLFTMSREQLKPSYEKLPEFVALCNQFDPKGKF